MSKPIILGTISLDLFAVLLGGATALLPMFTRDILHAGPWGLGLLRASPAIGALAMSIALARYPLKTGAGRKMLWAVAIFGLATMSSPCPPALSCRSRPYSSSAPPIPSASWCAARWCNY